MYKILISGYYGFNNIGDESILMAVSDNLREGLKDKDDIEITVMSHDPTGTAEKYGVRAINRKALPAIIKELTRCDLLISGGGSLLQDVTSKKSILYYLFIMKLAQLFGKKYFIYSQGIGPINSNFNRSLTAKILNKASGIVVRDESSREFLGEIGVDPQKVVVTADPVLRVKPADLDIGKKILREEGCVFFEEQNRSMIVGFAVKEKKIASPFVDELAKAAELLIEQRDCKILLIPFHFSEDLEVIKELERRLTDEGLAKNVCALKHKYLTNEMLSIIGNVDVLVGIRLHSLIHAAIMGVPMMGISYDPKVNSFMNSVGLKAMCSIYDFNSEFFLDEFDKTVAEKEKILQRVAGHVAILRKKLDMNEELIKKLMN